MKILITTQVFPPEIHPSARIVLELAQAHIESGCPVIVATGFPHHPHGRLLGGYRRKFFIREEVDSVPLVRGWHLTSTSSSTFVRAAVYVSQAFGTIIAAVAGKRPDVIINFGPPLVGPFLSLMMAKAFGARHIPVIYDLYPDVAIEMGTVKNGAIIRAAKAIERMVYRGSDRIVVLSEGFRRILVDDKGVPEKKVRVIPIWIDPDEVRRAMDPFSWRVGQGIPRDVFVVLYAGTIGLVSGAEIMVEVAREWSATPDVLFLFVGEGKVKERVQLEARGLSNIKFFDFQPREILADMLSAADVGVVTLLPGRGRTSVPSKVLGYMAVEVPVLASCDPDSDSARMIEEAQCGIVVPPGDAEAISGALRRMMTNRDKCRQMGKNGRNYMERHHSKEVGTAAFGKMIREFEQPAAQLQEHGCHRKI